MNLPPIPEPSTTWHKSWNMPSSYSTEQMREYGKLCRKQALEELRAELEALKTQEVFTYAVVCPPSKYTKYPEVVFSAHFSECCHEHINDAINEHGIDGATQWVVRKLYLAAGAKEKSE